MSSSSRYQIQQAPTPVTSHTSRHFPGASRQLWQGREEVRTLSDHSAIETFVKSEETNSTEATQGSVAKSDQRIRVELIVAIKSNNLIQ